MGASVNVNFRTVVHTGSGGVATALPDVCKTPAPPGPPVPIPYPNIAKSSDAAKGSKKVKCDGKSIMLKNSEFSRSMGDEAGTLKGVASNANMGKAKFVMYSFDVKVEGKNVPRLGDPMTGNGNAPNTTTVAELQAAMAIPPTAWPYNVTDEEVKIICEAVCECKDATTTGNSSGQTFSHKQDCVANELSDNWNPSNPQYDQRYDNMHVEPPYDMTQTPPRLLRSSTSRQTRGGAVTGASLRSGMGQQGRLTGSAVAGGRAGRRPDIVLTHRNQWLAEGNNIRQVIDVKFRGDPAVGPGDAQWDAYDALNPNGPEPLILEEDNCDCT